MKNKKYLPLIIITIALIFFFQNGATFVPAEEIAILSSIGVDFFEGEGGQNEYTVPMAVYNYATAPNVTSLIIKGTGDTIPYTREIRQLKLDRKFLLGLEKVVVIGEDFCKSGIMPVMDTLFENTNVNDTAYLVVTDNAENLVKLNIPGYPSSGDYIEGLIRHSSEQNFFPDKYKLIHGYHYMVNEGTNLVAPYIEIKNKMPEISGVALFKGDRMVRKIGIEDSKPLNLLRENGVRGTISVKKNPKNYSDVYITSKRKITVNRKGNKYSFNVLLNIEGYIVTNLMYESPFRDPNTVKKIESDVKEEIEKMTNSFVKKMQEEYKVDCINFGDYAAAKYGRDTGIDWNEVVTNSDINVDAKVKISLKTRGSLK